MLVPKRDRHMFTLYTVASIVLKDARASAGFREYIADMGEDPGAAILDVDAALTFFHDEMHDVMVVSDANEEPETVT